jgi:hypothetical protein
MMRQFAERKMVNFAQEPRIVVDISPLRAKPLNERNGLFTDGCLADQCPVQEVHSQTAEAQIFVGADWVANVSVCGVALFVSESIYRHAEELHAILEIIVDMLSCSSFYIELPFSKSFRSSLMGCQRAEPISNYLEASFDGSGVFTANVQRATS